VAQSSTLNSATKTKCKSNDHLDYESLPPYQKFRHVRSLTSTIQKRSLSQSFLSESSSSSYEDINYPGGRFESADVRLAVGDDCLSHTTEIDAMPCAGIRISSGKLNGLMVWRFVVRLAGSTMDRTIAWNNAVVGNFILDTSSPYSLISPGILAAMRYRGKIHPGQSITLLIQGVETRCVVGDHGECSRLSMDFLIAGSLTLFFSSQLDVPVLYVESNRGKPSMEHILQTVSRRQTIHQRVKSFIEKLLPPSP